MVGKGLEDKQTTPTTPSSTATITKAVAATTTTIRQKLVAVIIITTKSIKIRGYHELFSPFHVSAWLSLIP